MPCSSCNLQSSSPRNFLLLCSCGSAWHHSCVLPGHWAEAKAEAKKSMHTGCLQPPMPHPTLLAMIDASNRRLHGASVHAWRCSECANPNINVDHGQPDRQSPPLVYPVLSTIRGENQHRSIQGNQEQHKAKKAVGTRIHEWHEHVPSPRRTLRVQPITGITAAVWPPIRRKKKAEIHAQAREVENVSHDLPPKDQSRRGAVNAEHTRRRPDGRRQASKV